MHRVTLLGISGNDAGAGFARRRWWRRIATIAWMKNRARLTERSPAVLALIAEATDSDPVWGLRLCERSGLGPESVYPILVRFTDAGWIERIQIPGAHPAAPARTGYRMTTAGRWRMWRASQPDIEPNESATKPWTAWCRRSVESSGNRAPRLNR